MSLFDDVRTVLDYEEPVDDFTKKKINMHIAKGKQHLRLRAPDLSTCDFEDEQNHAHSLLLDFCRYDHSNASEEFDKNYAAELLSLRQDYEVRAYRESKEA